MLNVIETHLGGCRTEDMDSSKSRKQTVLDAEFFSGRDDLMLRTDLLDLHVYICAPEVLLLFSDNFDYQVNRWLLCFICGGFCCSVVDCLTLLCLALSFGLSCLALLSPVLSCPALPCHVLRCPLLHRLCMQA